jgi:hypothetical protein
MKNLRITIAAAGFILLGFMAMHWIEDASAQNQTTSLQPVLPDYWQTLSNATVSNVATVVNNGSNAVLSNPPCYLLKNGIAFMAKVTATNTFATQSVVVTISGDVSIDGTTNTTTKPFSWSFTVPAGTNSTTIVYTNLPNTFLNNCASITLDNATNSTAVGAGTNSTATINWIEYGLANQ